MQRRYGMVLAVILLVAFAACGSSPDASITYAAPPSSSALSGGAGPSSQALAPATAGTGSIAATFSYRDSNGDSLTQTYSFGSPVPESQLPDIAQQADSCELGLGSDTNDSANLVIPVTVTTTLNSDVATNASFDFVGSSIIPGGNGTQTMPLGETFVYNTSQGYICTSEGNDNGTTISLSLTQGSPAEVDAWIVLNGAISPDYPDGNPAAIGLTGISPQLNPGFSEASSGTLTASGPAVCTGGQPLTSGTLSLLLHIGGTVYSSEDCNSQASSD
jgi:hypothetical protein